MDFFRARNTCLICPVIFSAPEYSIQNMLGVWYVFDERMNNWRYDLDQMLVLSYISASLGFFSCFPTWNERMSELEGISPASHFKDGKTIPERRPSVPRSPLVAFWHPVQSSVFPHYNSQSPSFQCSVTEPISSPSSSLASALSHIPSPSSVLCMPPTCV